MVIEKYTQTATEYHEGKEYIVIEEWEKGHEDLIDPLQNPLGKKFIQVLSKTEIEVATVESLKSEIEDLKSRIQLLEQK